jgi:cytochrome c551/c552
MPESRRCVQAAIALLAVACGLLLASASLTAQDVQPPEPFLIPGPGMELTMQRCVICHEAQHITRSRLTRAEWLDNMQLMLKRGAPVEPHEVDPIVDYLFTYYGRNADGSLRARPEGAQVPVAAAKGGGAREVPAILTAYGCTACHATDRKLVGPSFREVAERFGGTPDGAGRVARRIKDGGAGDWGQIPMPAHPTISDEEMRALVAWVFAQR